MEKGKAAQVFGFPMSGVDVGLHIFGAMVKKGDPVEPVRDEMIKHFSSFEKMLSATSSDLEKVEGIGTARASYVRHYFDRLIANANDWSPPAS